MLVEKKYKVLISNRNISKFKDKYHVQRGDYCLVDVSDLSKGSHNTINHVYYKNYPIKFIDYFRLICDN